MHTTHHGLEIGVEGHVMLLAGVSEMDIQSIVNLQWGIINLYKYRCIFKRAKKFHHFKIIYCVLNIQATNSFEYVYGAMFYVLPCVV